MASAGNPAVVKVYPGVGHFIHTDVPYEFARDTVDFMKIKKVNAMSRDVVEALVKGVSETSSAGAPAAKPTGLAK
jgi:hypothetical protein